MKPPPRARKTPKRMGEVLDEPRRPGGRVACQWQRAEQRKLLRALKALHKTTAPHSDLDYSLLESKVPTRPLPEIRSLVEQLKNQAIATAQRLWKRTLAERRMGKPIEKWTQLAAAVTGSHEGAMSAAFSQMLVVLSTEPCTLKNHHHPPDPARPPPAGAPQPPCSENPPGPRRTLPHQNRTPSPALSAAVPTTGTQPDASRAGLGPPRQLQQPPSAQEPLITPPASSTPPAKGHQSSTEDTSRTVGGGGMVDFERIYCFLGRIQEPVDSRLTPMESAVVLDLLMSLPEELRLLDCNKLHQHFLLVQQCFSAQRDSKKAKRTLQELREGLRSQAEAPLHPLSQQSSAPLRDQPVNRPPREGGGGLEDGMDVPLLNPFMVPLRLLQRKAEN